MEPMNDQFHALYEKLHDKMLRVAYRMVGSMEAAEDLVQDAFLLALFRRDEVLCAANPEGWLMKTLQNLARNESRRLCAHPEVPLDALLHRAGEAPAASLEEMLPSSLSPQDRELLIWRFEQNLEYREIAARLGISETGCRSRVSRAVSRCRALMQQT